MHPVLQRRMKVDKRLVASYLENVLKCDWNVMELDFVLLEECDGGEDFSTPREINSKNSFNFKQIISNLY